MVWYNNNCYQYYNMVT